MTFRGGTGALGITQRTDLRPGSSVLHRLHPPRPVPPHLSLGAIAFAGGCAWVAVDSAIWYSGQDSFASLGRGAILGLVATYYAVELLAILVAAAGAYMMYRGLAGMRGGPSPGSAMEALAAALSSKRDLRVGLVAGAVYAVVYLLVSGVVVYQPGVDFAAAYGVSSPGWSAAACCGSMGTVPMLLVYLSPQAHLALQLLPLDALFAVVVPLLVGLNVAVSAYAVGEKALRRDAGLLGSVGILAGLFTGCPTCAGIFFAGAAGGLGATTLAIALAPYQMLFVAVSIPVLVLSPFVVASLSAKAALASCAVPGAQGVGRGTGLG